MHIFRLLIKAGPKQCSYPEGSAMAAVCMVDSQSTDEARQRACDRLFELGWESITFEQTVLLPYDPDISHFDDLMEESYRDAKRLGVSVIEYPEP